MVQADGLDLTSPGGASSVARDGSSSGDKEPLQNILDPDSVTDWDELDVDINLKQILQEIGLQANQGARLIKSCHIQREDDLGGLTHSDIGGLGLPKLAERRFISLLESWKTSGKGPSGHRPADATKALNLLVTAGDKENLPLVRDIIRSNNGKHMGVQQQACVTIRTMVARDEGLRKQAGHLGLLSDIQHAMRSYPDSAGVQKQALGAVWNMVAGTPENQDIAGKIGLLGDLQTAIQNFQDHAEVQKMACGALWQVSLGNAGNKTRAGQQGLLESLQTSMQRHPHNVEVQKEACGAIRSLTSDNAKNKAIAGAIRLLAELQAATHNHIENLEILRETCGAIWIMIAGTKDNRQWAGQARLLVDLQRVMRKYPRDAELQRQLANAIMHAAMHEPTNKLQAFEIRLLEDITKVLQNMTEIDTISSIISAASHLCHHCIENKNLAKECGLLDDIKQLTKSSEQEVAHAAIFCWRSMQLYKRVPKPEEVKVFIPELQAAMVSSESSANVPSTAVPSILSPRATQLRRAMRTVSLANRLTMVGKKSTQEE